MNTRIKKAKIEVTASGCIECGTQWSSGWQVARTVTVSIGNLSGEISLHICADCTRQKEKQTHQLDLLPQGGR